MEKDYVKLLMESDKPMEERLEFAGKMLNNLAEMNENSQGQIENYKNMIKEYEEFIEKIMAMLKPE